MRKTIFFLLLSMLMPLTVSAFELEGFYECSGVNSYGETREWSQKISIDADDNHKVWFSCFFPNIGDVASVYGVISDDGTTVSIPVGQFLKDEGSGWQTLLEGGPSTDTQYKCDISTAGPIVGTITESDGKLVISFDYWYSAQVYIDGERSSYWYGAIKPGATFTKNAALQEAETTEGVKVMIKVLDEEKKTCQIGDGKNVAIDMATTGVFDIPEKLNGYTVTAIATNAFSYCTELTSVSIPQTVTSIGEYAFSGMTGLTSIRVDRGNVVYSSPNDCNALVETATGTLIAACVNTTIPSVVKVIGTYAFQNCPLKSIDIPASVTSIGSRAFSGCELLEKVNFAAGSNLQSIESNAFEGCQNLTAFIIPDKVESIGVQAFASSGLKSITIPASVTRIEMGDSYYFKTFYSCADLERIVVEAGNTVYDSRDNCNAIIETATNTLLVGCKGTYIPRSITTIGDLAMCGVSLAEGFTIPEGVTEIRSSAFYEVTNLKDLVLPEGLLTLGKWAFGFCRELETVTLPSTLTTIGDYAFNGCYDLKKVISNITAPTAIGEYCFSNYDAELYVPKGLKEKYKETAGWNKFAYILEEGEVVWVPLGIAKFTDNFWFGESVYCQAYQNAFTPHLFRLENPFRALCEQWGIAPSEDCGKYIEVTVLQPGDVQSDVKITQKDLVYFPEVNTGYYYSRYDADIVIRHPGIVSATYKNEAYWTHNKVLTYQSNGLPAKIQLAPQYYMYGVGGFNQTQADGAILITFPGVEGDANGDGVVDVKDVVGIANHIADKAQDGFDIHVGDVNDDLNVDVSDMLKVLNLIPSAR